ncbi:MAG: PRC-barrel domain-containing protein [Geminicoccaceae bacterium]|nr:PRC-barrel domain-containing protein [Geminicoccaceae bacterium]
MSTAMLVVLTGVAAAQQQQPADQSQPAEQVQQQPAQGQPATGQAQQQPQEELEQQTDQAEQELEQQQESEQAEQQPAEGEEPATEQAEGQPAEGEQQQTAGASVDFIKTQEEGQTRAEELIGFDVITADEENIGEVKDLILDDQNRITGVVLSVGGFLGIGEKSVALPFDAVQVQEDAVHVNIDSGTLEEAPAFATLDEVKAAEQAQEAQMQQQQQMQQATQPAAPAPAE